MRRFGETRGTATSLICASSGASPVGRDARLDEHGRRDRRRAPECVRAVHEHVAARAQPRSPARARVDLRGRRRGAVPQRHEASRSTPARRARRRSAPRTRSSGRRRRRRASARPPPPAPAGRRPTRRSRWRDARLEAALSPACFSSSTRAPHARWLAAWTGKKTASDHAAPRPSRASSPSTHGAACARIRRATPAKSALAYAPSASRAVRPWYQCEAAYNASATDMISNRA